MDGRGSDFDDISILFMKMQKAFCSRICSKHPHKLFCRVFSSCIYMDSWNIIFFMAENCVVLAIMDMVSAKSDVNGAEKIVCFWRL